MNKKGTLPRLSVAILAYNAEQNVVRLLKSVLTQIVSNYTISDVVLYSDCSTDRTVSLAKKFKDKRLKIIDSKVRIGFAKAVVLMLKTCDGDIVTLLNDDIIVKDKRFLSSIVSCFKENVGLVSSNIIPLKANSFVERAAISGYQAYKLTAQKKSSGNNMMTCDGKSISLSRELINSINFPIFTEKMGNVDLFLYLECKRLNFQYFWAQKSVLFFKLPNNSKDFIKWQTRNYAATNMLKKTFGDLAEKELKIPFFTFQFHKLVEFFKNPLGGVYILLLGIYSTILSKNLLRFNPTWEVVASTKNLKYVNAKL